MRIYIASKSCHGPRWVEMRERGVPFISTWIDESGPGQTSDWSDLTRRCVEEASGADGMIVYAEPGEPPLKGALIEWGAALAAGKPVVYVGPPHKWTQHPLVETAVSVEVAISMLLNRSRLGSPGLRDPDHPCRFFYPGAPGAGDCTTDGHYLCGECAEMSLTEFRRREDRCTDCGRPLGAGGFCPKCEPEWVAQAEVHP